MRIRVLLLFFLMLGACDNSRVFEENADFTTRQWIITDHPAFIVEVEDITRPYTIKANFRNSLAYPKANLYYQVILLDSTGKEVEKKLVNNFLFDEKTGAPLGSSGLGDIFDHQFPVMENYHFPYAGSYTFQLSQYMRMDTLPGMLSTGIRIEKIPQNN